LLRDYIGKITKIPLAKENEWQMSMLDKTQYIIEQKLVAIRDTYGVKDVNGNLLGYVKAKMMSMGPKFWFEDNAGVHLGEIDGKVITIHNEYEIKDKDGQLKARIKKKILKLFGSEWWMEDPQGQQIAKAKGDFTRHDYQILAPDGSTIAKIHKKWVSIRDSYCIDISRQDFDPLLILGYAVAMDHVEQKNSGTSWKW